MRRTTHARNRPAIYLFAIVALGLALVTPLATQNMAHAQSTIIVTSSADSGEGSLRQAVSDVQAGGTITFADGLETIVLTEFIWIAKSLTIDGPGADELTVSGNNVTQIFDIATNTTVTINGLTIRDGSDANGAGIYNRGVLTISNSTISGNTASSGAGIYNSGSLTISNSTISGNTASVGGGIYNSGSLTISNSTIAGNSASGIGGGIWSSTSTPPTLTATLLANNAPGNNCVRQAISGGYNLSSDSTCFVAGGTDLLNTDPLLDDLADNGGPTETHALDPASPAVNAIPAEACHAALGAQPTDQRGVERPQFEACDIGAFELDIAPPAPVLSLPQDMTVEATGPDGALVDFEAHAVDWNDALLDITCDPASGSTFAIDTHEIECSATDSFQQTTTESFSITVEDSTPPAITAPADITVPATGPEGAVVAFEVPATDAVDPAPAVTCVPPSGSVFEIGTTEVSCTATDATENTSAPVTFTVTVLGGDDLLATLIEDTTTSTIPAFLKPRLLIYLTTAELALDRGQQAAACSTIQTFSAQITALSPSYITPGVADQLTSDAQSIRTILGC